MNKKHCDRCDKVILQTLGQDRSAIAAIAAVDDRLGPYAVVTYVSHPVTHQQWDLCVDCRRNLLTHVGQ